MCFLQELSFFFYYSLFISLSGLSSSPRNVVEEENLRMGGGVEAEQTSGFASVDVWNCGRRRRISERVQSGESDTTTRVVSLCFSPSLVRSLTRPFIHVTAHRRVDEWTSGDGVKKRDKGWREGWAADGRLNERPSIYWYRQRVVERPVGERRGTRSPTPWRKFVFTTSRQKFHH